MFISKSAAETMTAGERVARKIQPCDIIALVGDLGAGKTQFVKGLAAGLDCTDLVSSPTFTLVHEYRSGRLPIYHFDFYRIQKLAELPALGFDEYLAGEGVCVIEWADRFTDAIPTAARWLRFEIVSENERALDLSAFE